MPSYEIRGKGKESGRKRTRVYVAGNEEAAKRLDRTAAYKKASSLLREKTGIAIRGVRSADAKQSTVKGDMAGSARTINKHKGCLSVIALALLAPFGLILAMVWLGELKL